MSGRKTVVLLVWYGSVTLVGLAALAAGIMRLAL